MTKRPLRSLLSVASAIAIGCAAHASSTTANAVADPPLFPDTVPAAAPDSIPSGVQLALRQPQNLFAMNARDTAIRNAVYVRFRNGTPRAKRGDAIRAVHGRVAGGYRLSAATEGFYLVLIPVGSDGGLDAVYQAINRLKDFPQVQSAIIDLVRSPI